MLRLVKDELLLASLQKFVKDRSLHPGWFEAIGAVQWAELGFYKLANKSYVWQKIGKNLEIASLTGNVTWVANEPFIHAHGVFADEQLQTYGGHLKEAMVHATCEVWMTTIDHAIGRIHSDEIGLKLLDI